MSDEEKNTPDTHSKRIRFRKTETSRLKSVSDTSEQPQDQTSQPTTAKSVPKPPPGRTSVVDPMALRDTNTSKVKRVQAAKDSSPLATVTLPGIGGVPKKTETVQLKVVQQKKRELDQEMSPASTVRLKGPTGAGPSVALPKPRPGSTPRDTMKISLPTLEKKTEPAGDDVQPTVAIKPMPAEGAAPRPVPQGTAKVEAPPTVKTSTTVLEKATPKKSEPAGESVTDTTTADSGATISVSKPAGGARTLKLRGGPKSAKTLKLKDDAGDQTVAVADLTSDEAKTIKVEPSGKGLKFKGRNAALGEVPAVAHQMAAMGKDTSGMPGVFFTVANAAAFVAMGVTTYFLVQQLIAHIL